MLQISMAFNNRSLVLHHSRFSLWSEADLSTSSSLEVSECRSNCYPEYCQSCVRGGKKNVNHMLAFKVSVKHHIETHFIVKRKSMANILPHGQGKKKSDRRRVENIFEQ